MRTILLVRHGQTTGNSNRRYFGATDIPLSGLGREQMKRAATALAETEIDAAVTSPLQRARESAELVLAGRSVEARVVEAFREVNFGRWEGWTVEEIAERDPVTFRTWKASGPEFRFPDGDSRQEFRRRIEGAAREVAAGPDSSMLWVLHKGVIRVAVAALTGLAPEEASDLRFELGSIHRLESDNGDWRLTENNRVDHLGAAYQPDAD